MNQGASSLSSLRALTTGKAVSAKKAAEVINGFLASKMRAAALEDPLIRKRYWNIDPGCVEGQNIFGASERDVEDQYEWGPNTMLMGLHYKVRPAHFLSLSRLLPQITPLPLLLVSCIALLVFTSPGGCLYCAFQLSPVLTLPTDSPLSTSLQARLVQMPLLPHPARRQEISVALYLQ